MKKFCAMSLIFLLYLLLAGCGSTADSEVVSMRNTIVENPPKNEVTFQIDQSMVGRYEVSGCPLYFEIFEDGSAELSLRVGEIPRWWEMDDGNGGINKEMFLERLGKTDEVFFSSENLILTAYYLDHENMQTTYLSFNVVGGEEIMFRDNALSTPFQSLDKNNTEFIISDYISDVALIFKKVA